METVEIIIYIVFAFILGGLLLLFLRGIPFEKGQEEITKEVVGEGDLRFRNVNTTELIDTILEFWDKNKFKDINASTTIYAKDAGVLNKAVLFGHIKDLNYCNSLQSAEMNCGTREDVVMGSIVTPVVIRLTYMNDTLYISPEYEQAERTYTGYDFITFGGFEGQGTITKKTKKIPEDAILLGMRLKINSGRDFNLYINDEPCNNLFKTRKPVEQFDISQCIGLIRKGVENNITIKFPGTGLLMKYFGGGYIMIDYMTLKPEENITKIYDFPGILGSINLYSSFYIPGTLRSMEAYLHYLVDNSTTQPLEFILGNRLIHRDTDTEIEKNITFNNNQLASLLNYNTLSSSTIPLRFTASKHEVVIINITPPGGIYDIILVTDVSGSMDWETGGSGAGQCGDSNTPKIEVAKCVDGLFIDLVLQNSEHRIGLASYAPRVYPSDMIPLTNISAVLMNEINTYRPSSESGTCISCGILASMQLLQGSDRNKAILVMSDGEANRCIANNDPSQFTSCGNAGEVEAIRYAEQAREAGIEMFAIGFALGRSTETMRRIADDEDHFANGESVEEIEQIYMMFAKLLSSRTRNASKERIQTFHKINQTGNSTLFPDSYIKFEYTPAQSVPGLADMNFRVEQRVTDCANTVQMPSSFTITDAFLLAYSSVFWTKLVRANSNTVFNLENYMNYNLTSLGDPFQIYIPANYLRGGANTIEIIFTGSLDEDIECWNPIYDDNTFVYTVTQRGAASQLKGSHGCRWSIEFEDGSIRQFRIPFSYAGSRACEYTSTNRSYDPNDAYSNAVYRLLSEIDSNNDFRLPAEIESIQYYDSS
ncbi:VWA domain-containing protein [Candidatus Woesearchaeota archaeon]|nr:VWA domain-containing protein [Candidatus Woesearchaeota archaeon]